MKNFVLPVLLAIVCLSHGQSSFPSQQKIKSLMDAAMAQSDLPAVVAMAVNRKGETISYAHGPAVWTEATPVGTRHIFRIYSMTKMITSIAAMQLVEKHLLTLDQDLATLMPEMVSIPVLVKGQAVTGKNPITLRHLLTHTSGFAYPFTDTGLHEYQTAHPDVNPLPRAFESGTQFRYGFSTDWVGKVVEKISKSDLETYFRKNITGPLKMNRTWYNLPDSLKPYVVSRGQRGDDGKQPLREIPERIPSNQVTVFNGGGGLYSSPEDFAILLRCMLNGGTLGPVKILDEATVRDMTLNHMGNVVIDIEKQYYNPGTCCNFNGIMNKTTKWGLAWMIDNEDKPYGRKAGAVLWGGLLNTYFYIDYKSGIAASIYTQHLPFNHPETTVLFDKFSALLYGKE